MSLPRLLCVLLVSGQIFAQGSIGDNAALNRAKIVLLGEQTHGDGAVFDKKIELIKEFHENLGFNIVVFESGMYDNYKALQLFKNGKKDSSIFYESVYPWGNDAVAFQELFDYVSKNPEMKIMGFDSQEGTLFKEYYIDDLKSLLTKNNLYLSEDLYTTLEKTIVYLDYDPYINNKKDSTALYDSLDKVREVLSKIRDSSFNAKIIAQTFASTVSDFDFGLKAAQEEQIFVQNPRDKQMAENLIFLQEQFPNEKFIGWGASYHFANSINTFEYSPTTEEYIAKLHEQIKDSTDHNDASLADRIAEVKDLQNAIPMGQILKAHYGSAVYSMAFTSYEGKFLGGHNTELTILTPPENSLETMLRKEKSEPKLVDSKDFPADKFYTSALGYIPVFANWKTIFDGIYYIPKMYPPIPREYDEPSETITIAQAKKINGVVTDNDDKKPIPYADVYYSSSNKSVITNKNGVFSIGKNVSPDDYLIFSALGYLSDSIQLKKITGPLTIELQKSVGLIALSEVVVSSSQELTAADIVKKARKKVVDNYIQTPFNQDLFYRVQSYKEDSLTFNEEAIVKTYFKKGMNGSTAPESSIYGEILQIRNTTNNKSNNRHGAIGSLWVILNRDIILSKTNVLYRTSAYELKKEGLVEYDGKVVHKISFVNVSPGSFSTGYGYTAPLSSNGLIYIDKETFAVIHYEHCVTRDMAESKHSKYKWQEFHKTVQTFREMDGTYIMNLFKVIHKADYYDKVNSDYLFNGYTIYDIMSVNRETHIVTPIERPLMKLTKNLRLEENPEFWTTANYYLEDSTFHFEGCE